MAKLGREGRFKEEALCAAGANSVGVRGRSPRNNLPVPHPFFSLGTSIFVEKLGKRPLL